MPSMPCPIHLVPIFTYLCPPPLFCFPRPIMQKVSGGAPGGFPGAGEEGTLHLPTHHLSDSYELT